MYLDVAVIKVDLVAETVNLLGKPSMLAGIVLEIVWAGVGHQLAIFRAGHVICPRTRQRN